MEWWQCFVGAGTFSCFIIIVMFLRPMEMIRISQELKYAPLNTTGNIVFALVFQFVLWGVVLGTPVWFFYRLVT